MPLGWPKKKSNISDKKSIAVQDINKNFIVKAMGLIAAQGNKRGDDYEEPEFPLEEVKKSADADSYIKMALMKYSYLIYKAGYTLKADNDQALDYVKTRFKLMGFMTRKPMDILFQELADDMVKYSNAFLIKSRVDNIGFNIKAVGMNKDKKPIGGYFRADPTYIRIKRDSHGTILSYEQWNDEGETKKFAPTEVIHFYMDKDASHSFGTPRIIAALEDVKLLRRIEGNVISLIYRFAIPIYQWSIGLPQQGMQATETEIRDAQREVENMAMDGIVFTNERTNIKAIGAEGNALDASNYLAYFEKRVFTALGVSEAQMGRGGAKQDADSMEGQVHDTVKYIQRIMRIFIENMIISELLIEGGFNPILNESDFVSYEFNEINLDTKIKVENHEMLKFQQNIHTFEESRTNMGMPATDVDEERLYANMITKKTTIEQQNNQAENAIDLANVNAEHAQHLAKINAANKPDSTSGGKAGNDGKKTIKPNKDVENRNRPKNQHGTHSAKVKESLDVTEAASKKTHKKNYDSVYKRYDSLRNDITEENSDIDILIPLARDGMMSEMRTLIQVTSYDAIAKASEDLSSSSNHRLLPNIKVSMTSFNEEAEETITSVLKDIKKRLKAIDTTDAGQVKAIFDALEYRIRFLIEYIMPKAYWYSYIKAGAELGAEDAYIIFNGSKDQDEHPSQINTKNFLIEDIPAYHAFCDCKVSFKKAGDE